MHDESDSAARLNSLARHFAAAGDVERGAAYNEAAGAEAERLGAWSQARRHYYTALRLWEQADRNVEKQADLCLRLGNTAQLSGTDVAEGIRYLERARTLFA